MKVKMIVAIFLIALLISSMGILYKDAILANKKMVIRNGLINETAYAFYSPDGILKRIRVYRSTASRIVTIVPYTIKGPELDQKRHRYYF